MIRRMPLGIVQDYAPPDAVLAEMRAEYRMVDELARKAGPVE